MFLSILPARRDFIGVKGRAYILVIKIEDTC